MIVQPLQLDPPLVQALQAVTTATLTTVLLKRGLRNVWMRVAALITDGVVRDVAGVRDTALPVWCQGTAAPPSVAGLTFVGWQEPIDCGGVAVFPNDVIVADCDGAVGTRSRITVRFLRTLESTTGIASLPGIG